MNDSALAESTSFDTRLVEMCTDSKNLCPYPMVNGDSHEIKEEPIDFEGYELSTQQHCCKITNVYSMQFEDLNNNLIPQNEEGIINIFNTIYLADHCVDRGVQLTEQIDRHLVQLVRPAVVRNLKQPSSNIHGRSLCF